MLPVAFAEFSKSLKSQLRKKGQCVKIGKSSFMTSRNLQLIKELPFVFRVILQLHSTEGARRNRKRENKSGGES